MTERLSHRTIASPLGPLTLIAQDGQLAGVRFATTPLGGREVATDIELLDSAQRQLSAYFDDATSRFSVPLADPPTTLTGTVRQVLASIPAGTTLTYGQLARAVSRPGSARALGSVLAANPQLIVLPCHRIVASNSLGGYAGGLAAKRWLLDHEAVHSAPLALPNTLEQWPQLQSQLSGSGSSAG